MIGNPVDDKSEGVIMSFGRGVLVPGMVFVFEILLLQWGSFCPMSDYQNQKDGVANCPTGG